MDKDDNRKYQYWEVIKKVPYNLCSRKQNWLKGKRSDTRGRGEVCDGEGNEIYGNIKRAVDSLVN